MTDYGPSSCLNTQILYVENLISFIPECVLDDTFHFSLPPPSLPLLHCSDTGSYPPESCVFSFVLCVGAIIGKIPLLQVTMAIIHPYYFHSFSSSADIYMTKFICCAHEFFCNSRTKGVSDMLLVIAS